MGAQCKLLDEPSSDAPSALPQAAFEAVGDGPGEGPYRQRARNRSQYVDSVGWAPLSQINRALLSDAPSDRRLLLSRRLVTFRNALSIEPDLMSPDALMVSATESRSALNLRWTWFP
jgi:hypothetical protein